MKKQEKELVRLLKENARYTPEDLALMTGLSTTQVEGQIKTWEAEGIILRYTTVFNDEKFKEEHPKIRALIEVSIRPEKKTGFDAIARRICKHPNVEHYLISGNYDFLIIVEGRSLQEISSFVSDTLASIENVRSTGTHFILKKYKENGVIYGAEETGNRLVISA